MKQILLVKLAPSQLQTFDEYKAKLAGVPVLFINLSKTSQTCPECGYVARGNRKGESFHCLKCGFAGAVDYIAALNIRSRAAFNQPNVSKDFMGHFSVPPSGTLSLL